MVARSLCEALGWAIEIGAAIPDVGYVGGAGDDERGGDCRAHHMLLFAVALVEREVGPMHSVLEQVGKGLFVIHGPQQRGHDGIAEHVYRKLTRLLSVRVPAHAIGDDKESRWLRSLRGWAHALDGEECILVGRIFAYNTWVQSDANQQADRLVLLILGGGRNSRVLFIDALVGIIIALTGRDLFPIDASSPIRRNKRRDRERWQRVIADALFAHTRNDAKLFAQ